MSHKGKHGIMRVQQLNRYITSVTSDVVRINETIEIGDHDVLQLGHRTLELAADPGIQINGSHWTIIGGKFRAVGGVLFDCIRSSMGLMLNVFAAGVFKSKELFRCEGTNSCYDTNIIGGEWAKPQDMTTPIVSVNVSGPFYNSNRWEGLRFQTNGRPAASVMKLVCSHNANWIYGNTIDHINFEIPNAGAIHLESCFNTSLRQINIFDADLFGPITDDIIKVTKRSTGLKSKGTEINGYLRLSGALNSDKVDINIQDAAHYAKTLSVRMVDGIDGAQLKVKLPAWLDKGMINAELL